jgi:tetratricopeptide (TPR) repeat protein
MKVLLPFLLALGACASTPDATGPYAPPTELDRNTHQAELLSRQAADQIDAGDLEAAEALLREALTSDLFYGPAHNNLGVVFLGQGLLYEAAQEFEWAKKLLPSAPDPRVNLALVLERAGSEEEAMLAWEAALEVAPECRAALEGRDRLAWLRGDGEQP